MTRPSVRVGYHGHRGRFLGCGYGGDGTSVSTRTTHYGFLSVENVRDIERLIRETLSDRLTDKLNP